MVSAFSDRPGGRRSDMSLSLQPRTAEGDLAARTSPATGAGHSVRAAVDALGRGEMVVVVDAHDREDEGDLVMAAEHVTPAAINFMATHGRGLICVPMLHSRLAELGIPPMVVDNG